MIPLIIIIKGVETHNIQLTEEEILGTQEVPHNIININKMQRLMSEYKTKIHYLNPKIDDIKDPELHFLEEMIDWNLINQLLADENYTPGKRKNFTMNTA